MLIHVNSSLLFIVERNCGVLRYQSLEHETSYDSGCKNAVIAFSHIFMGGGENATTFLKYNR